MKKSEALSILDEKVRACNKCCVLAETRTNTVFGEGNANANIAMLGEAPGADEDEQGRPFVGRAGKLLDSIIEACGWERKDLFICNILKCRPPSNRNPKDDEAKNCRGFLDLQLKIVDPQYIVCLGKVAAFYLLNIDIPFEKLRMGDLRGKFHEFNGKKVLVTYHPAYLLRNPEAKKDVWEDLQLILKEKNKDISVCECGDPYHADRVGCARCGRIRPEWR